MPRAIWKGHISFGLVHIPIELRPAEKPNELKLSLLDADDHAPVGYVRRNKRTGEDVPWERIVRGYEVEKDRFVVLDDEDLKRANVEATQTIEILDFVELRSIPPVYFDRPYYVASGKGGDKGYALLREALRRTEKAGIANVVLHTRAHLAALFPLGDVLILDLLRYAHEIRPASEVDVPESSAKQLGLRAQEIELAQKLVEGMVSEWDPERYHDAYRDDLMALIRKKARGSGVEAIDVDGSEPAASAGGEVVDLMELLRKSMADRRRGSPRKMRKVEGGRAAKRRAPRRA